MYVFPQDAVDDLFSSPDETLSEGAEGSEGDGDGGDAGEGDGGAEDADGGGSSGGQGALDVLAGINTGTTVKGSVSMSGSVVAGFHNWDFSTAGETVSAYYELKSGVSLDVRPTGDLRFFSSLSVGLNADAVNITAPAIGELFVDYTLADTVFFRVGKQGLTWGQGNFIANPGNLVDDISEGISLKTFIPLGNNGLSVVIYPGGTSSSPLNFAYAALFEFSAGPLSFGLSGKFQRELDQALSVDAYLKTVIAGIDIALESRVDFDTYPERDGYVPPRVQAVSNVFWESDIGLRLFGEYFFAYGPQEVIYISETETVPAEAGTHIGGVGILFPDLFGGDWSPGLRWFHNFSDGSGQVVAGITGTIAPHLRLNIAIPAVYGASYGYYQRNNDDPERRRLSLVTQLTLSASF
ncbi:MAG: hypothetical protein ACR2PY_02705 [Salinispira sp.]